MGVVFGLVWGLPGSYGNGSGWSQGWLVPRAPWGRLELRRRELPVFVPLQVRPVVPVLQPRLPPRPEFVGDLSGAAERSNVSAGGRVCARRREARHGASEGGARERKTPSDPDAEQVGSVGKDAQGATPPARKII
jgi:hypothetical protein